MAMSSATANADAKAELFTLTIDLETTSFPDLDTDSHRTTHAFAYHMLATMARAAVIPVHAEAHAMVVIRHEQRDAKTVHCDVNISKSIKSLVPAVELA